MSDITATLWFLLLFTAVRADVYLFNKEMDAFFNQFRDDIRLANRSEFPLPNVQAHYTKKILYINFYMELNGTEGTLRDMTTIRRTGNVTMLTSKEHFSFRAEFGFSFLKIGYNYKAKFFGIPLQGELDVGVKDNSIFLEVLVNLTNDRCSGNVMTVRNLNITALDNISFRVTGFSIFNFFISHLLTYFYSTVSVGVKASMEEALKVFVIDNIKEFDFCKFGSVPDNIPFNDVDSSTLNYVERLNTTAN